MPVAPVAPLIPAQAYQLAGAQPIASPAPPAPPAPSGVVPAPDFLNPANRILYRIVDGSTWDARQLAEAGYTALQIAALPKA